MERIIIREIDNTSNVEALSSYDVAYVPGFSAGSDGATVNADLYRKPTLVTDKYQFIKLYGSTVPTFDTNQLYPVATSTVKGFPTWAIPGEAERQSFEELTVQGFIEESEIVDSGYYTLETVDSEWAPIAGNHYYVAEEDTTSSIFTLEKLTLETTEYTGLKIYKSTINPYTLGWYELTGAVRTKTNDTSIDVDKSYSRAVAGETVMFFGPGHNNVTGDADPGYRYALALLSMGMPVYFEQMNRSIEDIKVETMYEGMMARFVPADDSDYSFDSIGDYSVKFITSGGYPTYEYGPLAETSATDTLEGRTTSPLSTAMTEIAAKRQDAVALIDHTDNPDREITSMSASGTSVIDRVRADGVGLVAPFDSYGAIFTPWFESSHSAIVGQAANAFNGMMPGSFAFLSALAVQLQNYNPWLAVSGVTRGKVPYCNGLHTNKILTNNIADSYQAVPDSVSSIAPICINPITYIRNYGYCIWGNRTLRNNASGTKATSFLNIRDLVSDIKKKIYQTSQQLLFEQNTEVLWLNFKSLVTPLLNSMKASYILNDYNIIKLNIDPETGTSVPAYKILAVIRIQVINSVEVFDLSVQIENAEITVAELR